jgi:hypothetical protein
VLLDDRLQRVKLTDDERNAALAPFAHQQESDRSVPVLIEDPKQAGVSIWRRLQVFFGMLLLILVGVVGFWLWYVTTSTTPFQSPGMDINNLMPAPLNEWGCEQLKKRFGQDRAPFGCVADDYTSWK